MPDAKAACHRDGVSWYTSYYRFHETVYGKLIVDVLREDTGLASPLQEMSSSALLSNVLEQAPATALAEQMVKRASRQVSRAWHWCQNQAWPVLRDFVDTVPARIL